MIQMKFTSFTLIILVGLLVCGCMAQPVLPSPSKSTDGTYASETTLSALLLGTEIVTLDTTHQSANLSLDPGAYILSIQAQDAVDIFIKLKWVGMDSPLNFEDFGTFHTTGPGNGSVRLVALKKGEYQLLLITSEIINPGEKRWTAVFAPLPVDTSLKAPIHLSGTGSMVSPAFYLASGEYIFERDVTLHDSPLFSLSYLNGSILGDKNGTFQPWFGRNDAESRKSSTSVTIPESGLYFLRAYCSFSPHNWTASIIPL